MALFLEEILIIDVADGSAECLQSIWMSFSLN